MSLNRHKKIKNIYILYWLIQLARAKNNSFDRIKEIQFKKLQKLVKHTYKNHEFYRNLWEENGFKPSDLNNLDDLQKIPVLSKDKYRQFTAETVARNPEKYKKYYKDRTSGSTGRPLVIYRTWSEYAYMVAKFLDSLFCNGLSLTDKIYCTPPPFNTYKRDSIIQKFGILRRSGIHFLSKIEDIVQDFIQSKSQVIYSNKTILLLMAEYIQNKRIKIPNLKLVVCAGEMVDERSKAFLMDIYGPNFVEIYAAVEFNVLAYQILGEKNLNLFHEHNILEPAEECEGNEMMRSVYITDLNIYSFPLIRYELGDIVGMKTVDGIEVVDKIIGRCNDMVITKEGYRIPAIYLNYIVHDLPGVLQYRFIQRSFDFVLIRLVVDKSADTEKIKIKITDVFRKKISSEIGLIIEFRNSLEMDETGKLRVVISKIDQNLIRENDNNNWKYPFNE